MRGRKPKPSALKLLEGTRADRINDREPVMPPAASIEPPAWLDSYGRLHWDELAAILSKAGLLTAGDAAALAQLCDDFSTIRKSIEGPPADITGDYDAIRAYLANADKARDRYRRMLIEFGLTPSSRSRIKSTVEKPRDALEEFLAG